MYSRLPRNGSLFLLLALLMGPCLLGDSAAGGAASWDGLLAGSPAGLDPSRWQGLVNSLNAAGLSSDAARDCLAAVQEAARQGLPPDPVLVRLEEGVAKKAGAENLLLAGQNRLAALGSASAVLNETGYDTRNAANNALLKTVTLALESGLAAETVKPVLERGSGRQADRLQSIIEAGETMRLNQMDNATCGQMMADFTDRNLRRSEVLRASRFAIQQHKAHVDGARIRQRLWEREGAGGRVDAGGGKRQGAPSGTESEYPAGQGPGRLDSSGTGKAGSNGAGGPDMRPPDSGGAGAGNPTSGPGTPGGPEQQGRSQNGRN
jgi:hypothetical protein